MYTLYTALDIIVLILTLSPETSNKIKVYSPFHETVIGRIMKIATVAKN